MKSLVAEFNIVQAIGALPWVEAPPDQRADIDAESIGLDLTSGTLSVELCCRTT